MSRIGRKPIPLPPGVEVQIEGNRVTVRGARGTLTRTFDPAMTIQQEDRKLVVQRPSDSGPHRALHGLTRSLLSSMVVGASQGFERALEISGLGYRVQKSGEKLVLQVGYSHPVEYIPPEGISLLLDGTTRIRVQGADKGVVGQVAAELRRVRPPDPYKGKGIRYAGERLKLKPGKAGKAAKKA